MRKPSTEWARCRRAALERVVKVATDPIRPLNALFVSLCLFYLVGFARLLLHPVQSDTYSWIEAGQVLSIAISGVMIPLLAGAVILLAFIDSRIERLLHETD